MITINPDGSIQTDSVDEAIRIQQKILAANSAKSLSQAPKSQVDNIVKSGEVVIGESWAKIVDNLAPYNEKTIDTQTLAVILGVGGINGVGTKLRHLKRALDLAGINLDQYIEQRRAGDGTPSWTIHLNHLHKPEGAIMAAQR